MSIVYQFVHTLMLAKNLCTNNSHILLYSQDWNVVKNNTASKQTNRITASMQFTNIIYWKSKKDQITQYHYSCRHLNASSLISFSFLLLLVAAAGLIKNESASWVHSSIHLRNIALIQTSYLSCPLFHHRHPAVQS